MGVTGLWWLLEGNGQIYQIYKDYHFRDSKLVVDGSNLAYHLYFRYFLDLSHGGEYLAFRALVQAFFTILHNCGIKPYVVMDGGSSKSDNKLNNILERNREFVRRADEIALKGRREDILPPFTLSVFEQTLNDMKVPLVRCFGETDGQLAALAREWCCPVLSTDTDFYIYDLPEGVLPLKLFRWDGVETDLGGCFIPCKRYTTISFCTFFNIDPQLLPVFASLAENDDVNLREIKWIQFLRADHPRKCRLRGLLSWLGARTDQTTEDILTAAMDLMPDMSQQARTEVWTMVRMAMLEHQLPSSSLRGFFSEGTIPPLPAEMLSCVPDWVRAPLARGELSGDVLNVLVDRRMILGIQAELSDLQSSNLTSQPIRQVLYGLLLGLGQGAVREVDRVELEVQPLVQGAAQQLRLATLPQADPAVRLQVCLETLGVEEETLEGVPAHLRLPVAVTRYWLRRASPEPTLLKALLMVMVQGELIRQTGGTTGSGQHYTKHSKQLPDGVVAHSFNQWQACLYDSSQLNLLLCKPLPEPLFAWLYKGRLVHHRQKLLQWRKPEEIVQDDQFRRLYRSLLEKVLQPDPGANRRAGGPEAQLRASMEHLHLNTQEEEEEEEELGGAAGLDQGSDGSWVEVKSRRRKQ
ncbi:protein asteroid homolog 1-like [Gadus chalcogrammus]|uniref:protein asteroid homolog 1-like n=1 Tax=Gadus chalcogrammus TaxID=1042646 RepID=UPI0024C43D08|nr:protein asteroid homolog 1-like [Gadus chalcogrammus]